MTFAEYVPSWIAIAAFGFTGSLHCLGMCGPLASAACGKGLSGSSWWHYYVARLLAYAFLGSLSGVVGSLVFREQLALSSRTLAVVLGVLMTLFASVELMRSLFARIKNKPYVPSVSILKRDSNDAKSDIYAFLFEKLGLSQAASFGLLTALLPCGFLYASLIQAGMLADVVGSSIAMVVFALTTSPALFVGTFGSNFLQKISPKNSSVIGAVILLVASLSVLVRGISQPHQHGEGAAHEDHSHHGAAEGE
jgi:sulfite exporter TauE/SafE